ncbi:helix-turn-helix transcriptional regulator [Microbacterium sp. SORGH_AS_0888]|uniref:helix-turn-helix domain-containing protein n=1 Tax=Microbacterium sp. SORGH_AS_0888 TaxID=3041791 RepID=UPI00278B3395|nr:hypothetical protein [Microbacterium sp. SORGH_AS_0888]MDQ1131177.1 DNA-binding Xre family transcriptional regulator [Microbacterium sp. SORGH_AS_0888]
MDVHAEGGSAENVASQFLAAELRSELIRRKRAIGEAAEVLEITTATMARRLSGETPLTVVDVVALCRWLDVEPAELMKRAERQATAVAS